MKTLYELAKLNLKQSRVIDSLIPRDVESPLKKLKEIVLSATDLDDQKAMIEIYGKKNIAAFSRLKTRLRDILIRSTILQNSNLESEDSMINEFLNQSRNAIAIRILLEKKANDLSIDIAEKSILRAIKYHSTENVILIARLLVRHYGSSEYNKYKLNKYLEIQKKFMRIHEWEIKAENYYLDLQRIQLQSLAAPSDNTKEKARKYVEELEAVTDVHSYTFYVNLYKVKAAYYEYQKDYDSFLKLSENVQKDFSAQELKSNAFLRNINLRKAWALIQTGRNDEVISMGLKSLSNQSPGSLGWYFLAHYTLKALLYKGDYKQASELITLMIENPKFNKLGESFRELFYTTLGYMHLIIDSGLAGNKSDLIRGIPEFKLAKYLNATPVFSKDKRGINVSILLMHIAFLLQRKDYNSIIDKVDSLNQYAFRYLRKDDSFRSNCMIKMVIQMSKADFHPIRTDRYTHDLLIQLEQVKLTGSGENIETEIIPYEVLWKIMTKSL